MTGAMRKYGKYILAFLGVVLAVAWVGNVGSGKGGQDNSSGYERGKLDGKSITNRDIHNAEQEFQLLGKIGLTQYGLEQMLNEKNRPEHWFLLTREARRNGISTTELEISNTMTRLGLADEELQKFLTESGASEKYLRKALGDLLAVNKLIDTSIASVPVSLPQLKHMAADTRSTVQISYARLSAAKGLSTFLAPGSNDAPTEDAIRQQFENYRNVLLEDGVQPPLVQGHRYPFGYKWPDRVQVEFIKFDRAAIRQNFTPTTDDMIEALKVYEANPERFRNLPLEPTATATSQPAIKPFAAVKQKLADEQIDARVTRLMKKMADSALSAAKEPWNSAKSDEKGFRTTLPVDQWVSYKTIAEGIQKDRDFLKYLPTVTAPGSWLGEKSLQNLEGIGSAFFRSPQDRRDRIPFSQLAVHVKELTPENNPLGRLFLQVGVEGRVVEDESGNLYVYRVTAAQKSHEPANVDEMRQVVESDLRKLSAYKKLQVEALALAQVAQTKDFAEAAKNGGFSATTTPPFTRLKAVYNQQRGQEGNLIAMQPMLVEGLLDVPEFVETAFNLAANKSPTTTATTIASATQSAPGATTTISLDSKLDVIVLKLLSYEPCPINIFETQRPAFLKFAERDRQGDFLRNWVTLEATAARLNYIPDGGKFD